jgi:hypothetical protein
MVYKVEPNKADVTNQNFNGKSSNFSPNPNKLHVERMWMEDFSFAA